MPYVVALDQGTTSSRAIVFDEECRVRAVAQREFEQFYPSPGLVEHDPEAIWATQAATAEEALARAGIAAREVAAIGITNQRETTLLWDRRTGRPIHRAIVWQDRRTAEQCRRLKDEGHEARVRAQTGLVLDPYFSATKIAWLLDHVPGARARAEAGELAFGTVDTWLLWRMTGGRVHATDASNASRTLLFDLERGDWDEGLCALFRVPPALLPEVGASSAVYGEAREPAALAGVPVAGIVGDQQGALFGQACFHAGLAKTTYGTGCFLLLHTGGRPVPSVGGLLTTVAWRIGDDTEYALEGSVFVGGATIQWLRDGLGILRSAADVEALAREVEDDGGVVLVPAFTGLGAPVWDPKARGLLIGITRGTRRGHVARAALAGIAHQVADVLEVMRRDGGALEELRVDGGVVQNDLLLQLQADLLGLPIVRPAVTETTALGAAWLAGLATGVWRDRAALAARWREDRRFLPSLPPGETRRLRARWARALERSRDWAE